MIRQLWKIQVLEQLQLDAGWSDIGNWKALWERSEKDQNKNKCIGKTLIKDCNNCYIRSEKRLTVALGSKTSSY